MDLSIPLIGLFSYIGYSFNKNGKFPRSVENEREKIVENENPIGENIYHSVHLRKVQQEERDKLNRNFEKSKVPGSNMISYMTFNKNDDSSVFKAIDSQYTGTDYSSIVKKKEFDEKVSKSSLFNSSTFLETLKNGAEGPGLTGGDIPLTHSNMQAFYKGVIPKGIYSHDRGDRMIERLTGVTGFYNEKQEIQNMFTPERTKFENKMMEDSDRYVTSYKKNFHEPFNSIQVAPIPGVANRPVYRNVDDLRTQKRETYQNPLTLQKMSRKINSDVGKKTKEPVKQVTGQYFGPAKYNYKQKAIESNYDITKMVNEEKFSIISTPKSKQNIGLSVNSVGLGRLPNNKDVKERPGEIGYVNSKQRIRVSENFENLPETERSSTEQETYFPGVKKNQKVVIRSNVEAPTTLKEGNLFQYINNPHNSSRGIQTTDSFKNMNIRSSRDTIGNTNDYYTLFEKGPSINTNEINMKTNEKPIYADQLFVKSNRRINKHVESTKQVNSIQETDLTSRFLNKDVIEQLRKNYPYINQK